MNRQTIEETSQTIRFFDQNKFRVGLASCFYLAVILFFIGLAIVLPLQKHGRIDIGAFVFIALPAWIMIFIALYVALERNRWWIYPHWLWTAFKRVEVNTPTGQVYFITGWRPFRRERIVGAVRITGLVLSSRSIDGIGKSERFGLKIRFDINEEWQFLDGFRDESLFRKQVRALSELLDCSLSDLTYSPVLKSRLVETALEKKSKRKSKAAGIPGDYQPGTEDEALPIAKGITEVPIESGGRLFSVTRRHEWPASVALLGVWIGIYILTWALGWTRPSAGGAWEGIWLFFAAVLIFFLIKMLLPVREIVQEKEWLSVSLRILGITWIRKRLPTDAITRVTCQQTESLSSRLIIITDESTLKIGDLTPDAARYLESRLMRKE